MIDPNHGADARIGGEPVLDWLRGHRRELVDRVVRVLVAGGSTVHPAELRWIVDFNVGLFMETLQRPGAGIEELPGAADLAASAATRAGEGSTVDVLIGDYVGGLATVWREIVAHVAADELAGLRAITDALLDYLRAVTVLVTRGFQQETLRIGSGERDARFAVYSALLSGTDPQQKAQRAGISLAPRYLVLSLRIDPAPEDRAAGWNAQVPLRRRDAAVRRELDAFGRGEALMLLRDPVGTALVPLDATAAPTERDTVRDLVRRLSREVGAGVRAGAAVAGPAAVSAAARQAEEILELAAATGMPDGAWFLDDVLIPYQLTRPGPARDLLAARLAVLDAHPDWERTLRAYLHAGYDRRRAATALRVHPNTVDYRLGRIGSECGLDATDPGGRPVALAALAVRDLERHRRTSLEMSQEPGR